MIDHNAQTLLFLAACLLCAFFARTPGDARVWLVLSGGAVANFLLNVFLLDRYDAAWEPICLASLDFLVIAVIAARFLTPLGCAQVALVSTSWATHYFLYLDVSSGTSIVYDVYEHAVLSISALQIVIGCNALFDGIRKRSARVLAALDIRVAGGRGGADALEGIAAVQGIQKKAIGEK